MSGKREATTRRYKRTREPESYMGLENIGACGKCGSRLPVTTSRLENGAKVYSRRHLCFGCEPVQQD